MSFLKKVIYFFFIIYTGYVMFAYVYYFWTLSSKAQTPITPTLAPMPPACLTGIKNISYHDRCGKRKENTFRRVNFRCNDNSRGEFRSKNCLNEAEFYRAAFESCENMSKCLTPSITPTPPFNSTPIIITSYLPYGQLGNDYSASITALDKDQDPLDMKIEGLPPGITQGPCQLNAAPISIYPMTTGIMPPRPGGFISCNISGIPTQAGYFKVVVSVSDSVNPPAYKGLPLGVGPFPSPICPSPPVCKGGTITYGDPVSYGDTVCPLYLCSFPSLTP